MADEIDDLIKLESTLECTEDLAEQAELIISIYRKHKSKNSTEGNKYIARLENIAEALDNNEYKGWVCFFKGDYDWLTGNYNEAKGHFEKSIDFFSKVNNKQRAGHSLNYLGIISEQQGNYFEALENYNKAKLCFEESNDKSGIAICFNNIGILQKYQGNYPEALNNYFESLKIHESLLNYSNAGLALINISSIFLRQDKIDESIKYNKEAIEKFELSKDKKGISLALNNLATSQIEVKQYETALDLLYKSISIAREIDSKVNVALAAAQLGTVFITKLQFDKALNHLYEALDIYRELDYKAFIVDELCQIAICYRNLSELEKASSYLDEAYQIAITNDIKVKKKNVYYEKYLNEKNKGNFQDSLSLYEDYITIAKDIENEETNKKIAGLQFGYQIEKKEHEVTLEREKKEEIQKAYDLLDVEKQRSESLLLNILPHEVANELKENGSAEAKLFKNVTVLFTDFKGFTTLSEKMTPKELVSEIHECFKAFDGIMGKYSIEKIKTVGDAYLAVSGLPIANGNHATDIVNAALEIRDFMLVRKKELKDKTFEIRIGINSGEAIAGIVGVKKYAYDIWGDTVNTAARMEQNCDAGHVNISQSTYELIREKFDCAYRGEFEAKNKGLLRMYYVKRLIS